MESYRNRACLPQQIDAHTLRVILSRTIRYVNASTKARSVSHLRTATSLFLLVLRSWSVLKAFGASRISHTIPVAADRALARPATSPVTASAARKSRVAAPNTSHIPAAFTLSSKRPYLHLPRFLRITHQQAQRTTIPWPGVLEVAAAPKLFSQNRADLVCFI
jgi:hypothetical protein